MNADFRRSIIQLAGLRGYNWTLRWNAIESEKERAPGRFLTNWLQSGIEPSLRGSRHPAPSELPWRLVAGGYPEAVRRMPAWVRTWQKQYLRSIIEGDIQDVASVKDGGDVARLLVSWTA